MTFGYVAALTERTGRILDGGIVHTLATWEPYALVVGGAVALLLTQSAFNAGALRLSLPTLTVAQPLVAVGIGIAMFGEPLNRHGLAPVAELLGLVLVTFGVFALLAFTDDRPTRARTRDTATWQHYELAGHEPSASRPRAYN